MNTWSNLAKVVYRRTYSREVEMPSPIDGVVEHRSESWTETCDRVIDGNLHMVAGRFPSPDLERERDRLRYYLYNRKAIPAGRGLWFSGTRAHRILGGAALNNCWFTTSADWNNFVWAQDMLMLGGGVGMTVEHAFTSKLPHVKRGVTVRHKLGKDDRPAKDADFIVPDSREGWCELTRRVLEAFFETGRSFTYSTVVVRGYGEPIKGFGGTSSGPQPMIRMVDKVSSLLKVREGEYIRPLDAADILTAIGEMVVMGNVRRSAILILGDPWDKEYLQAKRWDIQTLPTQRAMANFSVVCSDAEDLHPAFWRTYENGEPFGLVNRDNMQRYGRIGELRADRCLGVNPCGEATLENREPCNLQEIALPNLTGLEEFAEAARLMHRWGKRVTLEHYHDHGTAMVVERNRRVGTSITGCLQSPLFSVNPLDIAYGAIQEENKAYSALLGIEPSVRTTVVKPSGSVSKLLDVQGEGVHGGWSRYFIQRVRIAANDPLIPRLRAAGHHIEPVRRFDDSLDPRTLVVNFPVMCKTGLPVQDEGWDLKAQFAALETAQRHWADQSVSVTATYRRSEIQDIRDWVAENIRHIKSVSFLAHSEHGFQQAPKEAITENDFNLLSSRIQPLDLGDDAQPEPGKRDVQEDPLECATGACPAR